MSIKHKTWNKWWKEGIAPFAKKSFSLLEHSALFYCNSLMSFNRIYSSNISFLFTMYCNIYIYTIINNNHYICIKLNFKIAILIISISYCWTLSHIQRRFLIIGKFSFGHNPRRNEHHGWPWIPWYFTVDHELPWTAMFINGFTSQLPWLTMVNHWHKY